MLSIHLLIFLSLIFSSTGKPVTAPKVKSNADALKFFDKFGYNQCRVKNNRKDDEEGPLCQSDFRSMIKHFQTIFRLPVTGKLDEQTITLMNKPRCSLGDYPLAFSAFRPW